MCQWASKLNDTTGDAYGEAHRPFHYEDGKLGIGHIESVAGYLNEWVIFKAIETDIYVIRSVHELKNSYIILIYNTFRLSFGTEKVSSINTATK